MQPPLISYPVLHRDHASFSGTCLYLFSVLLYWFGVKNVAGLTNFTVSLLNKKLVLHQLLHELRS